MSGDGETGGIAPDTGRRLFAQACAFVASAPTIRALPAPTLPEVAFAGRSNAGKSSLINALTGRRDLARASRTPGRTRAVNIFDLGGRLHLVDLPGYGYARAGRGEIARWTRTLDGYLSTRATLQRVCMVLDARRGPTDSDREAFDRLDLAGVAYQVVLTKTDKVGAGDLAEVVERSTRAVAARPAAFPRIAATSSRSGDGIAALRDDLAVLALPAPLR